MIDFHNEYLLTITDSQLIDLLQDFLQKNYKDLSFDDIKLIQQSIKVIKKYSDKSYESSFENNSRGNWTKDELINLIESDDRIVGLFLLVVYRFLMDTDTDKIFPIIKSFKETNRLTKKQLQVAKKEVKKYINQLVDMLNE